MSNNVYYFGTRNPLIPLIEKASELEFKNHPDFQIVDLGGAYPLSIQDIISKADKELPTVILSNRRYNLSDSLGEVESKLLEYFSNVILFRTAPLDINVDLYKKWAASTGVLLVAFEPRGVAWLESRDLVDAIFLSISQVHRRSGKAYDLTGPDLISMQSLKSYIEKEVDKNLEIKDLDSEDGREALTKQQYPQDTIEWLINYQKYSSDNRLAPTTSTLEKILNKKPKNIIKN